jgi:hypothetical protein
VTMLESPRGPGASPRDRERIRILLQHIDDEREAIARYDALHDDVDDAAVRYLVDIIADDEQRHHDFLREMLHHEQACVSLRSEAPQVPWRTRPRNASALRSAVRTLRRVERRDLRELRSLKRRLLRERDHSLLPLLCDLMVHDTKKHLRILRELDRLSH